MGSGLIWAGIGKGVADAGATMGNALMKGIDDEVKSRRELALEELREQRKIDRDERDKKNRMDEANRATAMADEVGRTRSAGAFDKLAASSAQAGEQGDIALSQDQLRELVKNDPELGKQYQNMGLISAAMPLTRNQERMQRVEDEYASAVKIGAHSTVLEAFEKRRKAVLDEIKEENKDERERRRDEQQGRRLDQQDRRIEATTNYQTRMADSAEVRARAAETKANQPPAEGRGQTKERLTTMINSANQTIKSLNESSKGKTPEERAAWQQQMDNAVKLRNNAQRNLNKMFEEDGDEKPAAPAGKPGNNQKPAASVAGLPQGAVQIGTSGGKPVYQTPDGKKFIAK